ncbi:MAG: hypothetical protein DDT20_01673 [Firmicutes bacterium]|nr:hypothetical protein [Bacillota bacterium]
MRAIRGLRIGRVMADSPLIRLWERELKSVGGVVLFGFRINRMEELVTVALGGLALFSLTGVVGATMGGFNPLSAVFLLGGLGILFYTSWRSPIELYKASFLRDGELPTALEMVLGGMESGMGVENTLWYISKHLKGVVGRLFMGVHMDIDAGKSVNDALTAAAERSLSKHFERFVALIVTWRETGGGDTQHYLKQLLEEIEEGRTNTRIEAAGKINNTLFFPIFLGYFLPTLILFSLPFIFSLRGMLLIL